MREQMPVPTETRAVGRIGLSKFRVHELRHLGDAFAPMGHPCQDRPRDGRPQTNQSDGGHVQPRVADDAGVGNADNGTDSERPSRGAYSVLTQGSGLLLRSNSPTWKSAHHKALYGEPTGGFEPST
jgi:hypothetical protein